MFSLWTGGVTGLTLNSFNFLFLSLGMVLTANYGPEYYAKLIREGIQGTWGFILQFPFYAGIFGLISFTGLGVVISGFFTSISTATTWPVIGFLYSGLLNIAVPSGGSKFIIEAPYIIPTTVDFGADMGLVLQAYQMGDGATNLLIPFFALPYLANFKIKFSQVGGLYSSAGPRCYRRDLHLPVPASINDLKRCFSTPKAAAPSAITGGAAAFCLWALKQP